MLFIHCVAFLDNFKYLYRQASVMTAVINKAILELTPSSTEEDAKQTYDAWSTTYEEVSWFTILKFIILKFYALAVHCQLETRIHRTGPFSYLKTKFSYNIDHQTTVTDKHVNLTISHLFNRQCSCLCFNR